MKNKIINIAFITTICAFLITSIFFLVNKSFNNHIVITKEYTQKNNILLYSFPAKYHEESTQEDLNTTNEDIIYQNYNDVIEVINDKNNTEKNKQDNIIEDNYLSQDNNNNNNNQNIEILQEDIQNSIISNNQIISKKDNIIFGIVNNKEISIEDRTTGYCAQALDFYYQDYYFTCIKSQNVFVIVNNNEFTISYALNNKIVTIDELIQIGFKPLKKNNYAVK